MVKVLSCKDDLDVIRLCRGEGKHDWLDLKPDRKSPLVHKLINTGLLTYWLNHFLAGPLTVSLPYLLVHLFTFMPFVLTYLLTPWPTHVLTHSFYHLPIYWLTHLLAHRDSALLTQMGSLNYWLTHWLSLPLIGPFNGPFTYWRTFLPIFWFTYTLSLTHLLVHPATALTTYWLIHLLKSHTCYPLPRLIIAVSNYRPNHCLTHLQDCSLSVTATYSLA